MCDHKNVHRKCATRKIIPAVRGIIQKCPTRKRILAFSGDHGQRATRKTFLRSEVATESWRPEKQHSGVQGRPFQMPDQKQRQRATETTLHEKMRDQKKNKTTNNPNTCYDKLRDQKHDATRKKNPVVRCGHRKRPTRKTFLRSEVATESSRPEKTTFRRSGAAIENARPEE